MRKFLDEIENAAARLQDMGGQAADAAKGACEKIRPTLEDGFEKTVQGAKELYARADEGLDRMVEEARSAFERAIDSLTPSDAAPVQGTQESASAETPAESKPLNLEEQLDLDVEAQVNRIRAAQNTPGIFSDYIAKKFGKDKQ